MDIDSIKSQLRDISKSATDKQHASGKLTARERVERFFDKGTFTELGLFIEHKATKFGMQDKVLPYDGVITGYGDVNGRKVFSAVQDFRVSGGTVGRAHATKIRDALEMAIKTGCPFVFINDSGGARIQEGVDALSGFGDIFYSNTKASGVIPQISIILGPCAGGAVYSPALTDFIFTVEGVSKMFITGPNVIKSVTGEICDAEDLGGARVHSQKSGVAHFISNNEDECFLKVKELLSYIPQNNLDDIPEKHTTKKQDISISDILPDDMNKPYDVVNIIKAIADDGEFFQIHEDYAKNIAVGFITFGSKSVGVIANNPKFYSGCLDVNASDKAARFIRFCDCFNIPLLTLVDVPGFLPGVQQEHDGIIRHGAKLLYAYSEASVPKITLITRKAYGGAYIAMCSKHLGADFVFAYANAQIAVMGAEGACNIIFANEIKNSQSQDKTREEKIREYKDTMMNPFMAAKSGWVDDIIAVKDTKKALLSAFDIMRTKNCTNIKKKHGNIPL